MQLGMGNLKRIKVSNKQPYNVNQDISNDGDDANIFFRGWVKYFHYTEQEQNQPKAFFKNVERERENSIKSFSDMMSDNDKVS
jgi:hypothetical protein